LNETAAPWQRTRTPSEANRLFPVVEDIGVPVKGLLVVMLVFAVLIGPVNLVVLSRKKRKLWLFWTVPLISFITCLVVILSMAVTEGWQGRSRIEGLTLLDENSRRASTIGWTAFYSPLLPSGGLHFSPETELSFQNGADGSSYSYRRRRSSGTALTIDWSREQHLSSGWLTPRVPAHFQLRRSEQRRERMTISRVAGGAPEAVNGLGADLTEFWYRDENDLLFHAARIAAGERVALEPAKRAVALGKETLRSVYAGEWSMYATTMKTYGPSLLAPRTYLAFLDSAPFMDEGLPDASVRKTKSVVYGILKEGGSGD
jgi:amino acid transporter